MLCREVTVLIGACDPAGNAILAADTCRHDEDTDETSSGHLKTIRLNSMCAVGFSGDVSDIQKAVAHLYSLPHIESDDESPDIIQRIEDEARLLPYSHVELIERLTIVLQSMAIENETAGIPLPSVCAVLVGVDSQRRYLAGWGVGEKSIPSVEIAPRVSTAPSAPIIFGPNAPEGIENILHNCKMPLLEKIQRVCGLYAQSHPKEVDKRVVYRSAANGFAAAEVAAILPTSSSADPNTDSCT